MDNKFSITFTFMKRGTLLLLVLFVSYFNAYSQDGETQWLIHNNSANPSAVWKGFTASVYPLALATPSAILAYGYLKKDKHYKNVGWYLVGSLAANTIVTQGTKYIVNRRRPYLDYPSLITPYQVDTDPSFPSGHTSTAFATAAALSIAFPKWYIVAPAYAWATGVGYSRIKLGEHYPSDVLVGAAVGVGTAYLCNWLNRKFFNKETGVRR